MHRKLIATCISLVAFAAFAAMPALASASPVLTDEGVALGVGKKIEGTNTTNIVFTGSFLKVTCTVSTLTGEVKENSGTSIKGTMTKATFTNAGGADCTDNFGTLWKVTTEIAKTDWCISTNNTMGDKFTLQAGACGGAAAALNFVLESGSTVCNFSRAATKPVEGTYVTGTDVLTMSEPEFTLVSGGGLCPGTGKLDGSYTLETDETKIPVTIS
jgi:hypothetical protein